MDNTFICNSRAFTVVAENELSTVLSTFSSDVIFGALDTAINMRKTKFDIHPSPNLVAAYETNFNIMKNEYPGDKENINYVRDETYQEIIDKICKEYNVETQYSADIDKYSIAYALYDFFVSNYHYSFCSFMTKFIKNEYLSIYNTLNLQQYMKNKDVSTITNKSIFKDNEMAIVVSNMYAVVSYIRQLDITLKNIVDSVMDDNWASIFRDYVKSDGTNINDVYAPIFNNNNSYNVALTQIKFGLQNKDSEVI